MTTCRHCAQPISQRQTGTRAGTNEPITQWCVPGAAKDQGGLPTMYCDAERRGMGWFVHRYHEPEQT